MNAVISLRAKKSFEGIKFEISVLTYGIRFGSNIRYFLLIPF